MNYIHTCESWLKNRDAWVKCIVAGTGSAVPCIVASRCSALLRSSFRSCRTCVMCCSVLQCNAVCCSVLQCVGVCCSVLQSVAECCSVLHCAAVCCSVLQCVALCYSVLQLVTVRCSVFPPMSSTRLLNTQNKTSWFVYVHECVCVGGWVHVCVCVHVRVFVCLSFDFTLPLPTLFPSILPVYIDSHFPSCLSTFWMSYVPLTLNN